MTEVIEFPRGRGRPAGKVTFQVEPRDVPAKVIARRLGLTEDEFSARCEELYERGFPRPDITTGMFDLIATDRWMDARHETLNASKPRDASSPERRKEFEQYLERIAA